jgi:large subunit ribosomal protein L25
VALDEEIKARVAVEAIGEPVGVKDGGVLEIILHELEIACLPMDLPKTINVDVSSLAIGDSIHVKSIVVSDKIRILNDPELTVVAVAAPKTEEEVAPAAAPAEGKAEPELVAQKGKKEVEGEEGEAPAEGAKKEAKKEPEKKSDKQK